MFCISVAELVQLVHLKVKSDIQWHQNQNLKHEFIFLNVEFTMLKNEKWGDMIVFPLGFRNKRLGTGVT